MKNLCVSVNEGESELVKESGRKAQEHIKSQNIKSDSDLFAKPTTADTEVKPKNREKENINSRIMELRDAGLSRNMRGQLL